jgi:hypothetical protein
MIRWRVSAPLLLAVLAVVPLLLIPPDNDRSGPRSVRSTLGWDGEPKLTGVPELPFDRILIGRLVNESLRPVNLDAEGVKVLDIDGRALRSTVRFASTFAHGLFSAESIKPLRQTG